MAGLPLAATGLSLAFDGETVLDLPLLDLQPGTLTVLSGPSGSGKSSLLYLLSGLLRPTRGSIVWNGQDLVPMSERARDRWRRRHAGFVFQDFHLIEEMSPLDNVLVPVWFEGGAGAGDRERATMLLEQLEVPHRRTCASQLSRGQQQRLAIARALIRDAGIVFADEPTASLDAQSGRTVIDTLGQLATAQGRTVVAASHDPALRERASGIVALDHGRINRAQAA